MVKSKSRRLVKRLKKKETRQLIYSPAKRRARAGFIDDNIATEESESSDQEGTNQHGLKSIKISNLQDEIAELTAMLNSMRTQNSELNLKLQDEKESFDIRLDIEKKGKDILLNQIVELEKQLKSLQNGYEQNKTTLDNLRRMCKRLFNSRIDRNFKETYLELIEEIKLLYDSQQQGGKIGYCPAIAYITTTDNPSSSSNTYIISENTGSPLKRRRIDRNDQSSESDSDWDGSEAKTFKKSGRKLRDTLDESVENEEDITSDSESDNTRSDTDLTPAFFEAYPHIKTRYRFTGKLLYHCDPKSNLWRPITRTTIDTYLRTFLKCTEKLTKREQTTITLIRKSILSLVHVSRFKKSLNSNYHLFVTDNKTIDLSIVPPLKRRIKINDLAEITCGWSYNNKLSKKYQQAVRTYFETLFPLVCERAWFLSYIARMLNGDKIDSCFLLLSDENKGQTGKTTLISLLEVVFGNYYLATTKIATNGQRKCCIAYDIASLKRKRLLVAEELEKEYTLDSTFIRRITEVNRVENKKEQKSGTVRAGLLLVTEKDNVPEFDRNSNNNFRDRMVACPIRSRFVSKKDYVDIKAKGNNITNIHIADKTLKDKLHDWRSAVLDLLIEYYDKTIPPIPESMKIFKKDVCVQFFNYSNWLETHLCATFEQNSFVSAAAIMEHIQKLRPNERLLINPFERKDLKDAMIEWAAKYKFTYKDRYRYYPDVKDRNKFTQPRSVILGVCFDFNQD